MIKISDIYSDALHDLQYILINSMLPATGRHLTFCLETQGRTELL